MKYTPEGGKVTVSADAEREYVHLSVEDTGFGIAEGDLGRIFERFYRVKNDNTRFIPGTGLGLAIVKSIVEAHHGSVRVESEIGHGSTFHVLLPVMLT
jgi:signal transduction histidine kinase